jgi:hypothetical protein
MLTLVARRPSWAAPQRSASRVAAILARRMHLSLVADLRLRDAPPIRIVAGGAVLSCLLAWSSVAQAIEHAWPAAVLVEHCRGFSDKAPSAAGTLCESYLRGYLAGARSGGWISFHADGEPQETFSERAWRTRLGKSTRSPKPRSCLPDGTTLLELATTLAVHAERRPSLENVSAEQLVEDMLRAAYPCSRVPQ